MSARKENQHSRSWNRLCRWHLKRCHLHTSIMLRAVHPGIPTLGEFGDIPINHPEMCTASKHDKNMEDLVEAKEIRPWVRSLGCIDQCPECIEYTTGHEPENGFQLKGLHDRAEPDKGEPSRTEINRYTNPSGGMYPEYLEECSQHGYYPYRGKHAPAESSPKRDETEGCVRGCHEDKDHDVVEFSESGCFFVRDRKPVEQGADGIEANHAGTVDDKCCQMPHPERVGGIPDKENQAGQGKNGADTVSEPVHGLSEKPCIVYCIGPGIHCNHYPPDNTLVSDPLRKFGINRDTVDSLLKN